MKEIAEDKDVKEKVDKLVCFCGIETLSALVIVSKVGDFNRFTKTYHFSNYIGLTCEKIPVVKKKNILGLRKQEIRKFGEY